MSPTTVAPFSAAQAESFEFTLNGERVSVEGVAATTTLLDWLRRSGRTGSKCGCAEGDCGACTVALVDRDANGRPAYRAINSCIALLPMFAGRELVTVEGLAGEGSGKEKLHPVQAAMVGHYGSQCGYCTPGFVVSMFEAYYRGEACRAPAAIGDQLCGNLCRCTGYRPIREAMRAALARGNEAGDAFAERLTQPLAPPTPLHYAAAGERFFRPTSLSELFALKNRHADAKLVAGATEIGVELNKKFKKFPALISTEAVPQLTRIAATPAEWRIGAAATLTAIEEALAGEYPSLAKMLAVFASRQIRNRATLGGNLATASPIGDSAPVLLTLDASIVLASTLGERTLPLHEFFTGYRKTQLRPDEIILEIVLPRNGWAAGLARRVDFQKVSHRRELDISIVAGAFCVDCDASGIVRRARLAYGGVAAMPARARRAEAALEGKKLAEAVGAVAEILRGEFQPIDDVRGSAAYRRGVVVSLWEKFVAGETSLAVDAPTDFAAGKFCAEKTEGETCAAHDGKIRDDSRELRHESAIGHVTGRAQYADDVAQWRPMLEVWPVMAPHARAKILRRDADGALAMPGVVAVLMAEDVPGLNNVGVSRHDEPLFAADEVRYHGHIVALVVGETLAACRAAAALVEVDYEPLPPVLTIAEAIAQQSFHNEPRVMRRGDCATALATAPRRMTGEFSFGGQEHFYLETQAAWAECGDEGDVRICSSTQHPSEIQTIVSEVLALPRNKIVVQAPRMGGGFGGKETQGNTPAALVALAALKTGRPVRVQFDRDVDMALTGKRHPFHADFEVGFDGEGRILALRADLISDGGWSLDLSQPVLDRALFHIDNAYYLPAVALTGRVAKTNVASNTAFRGFGGPQGMLVIEEVIDRIARALGLAPEIVRERNLYHGRGETNTTHYGEEIGDNRIPTMWRRVQEEAKFAERRAEIMAWNRAHVGVKRGLAVTPVKFGISFTLTHYNQAGALVHIYQDGSVQVNHGGTEMGQGLHTKTLGVAMRELGLPATAIRMMPTSTDKVPNTSATAASAGADLNGAAVRNACATLRERIAPVAARLLAKAAEEKLRGDVHVDIADSPRGERELPAAEVGEVFFENGEVFARSRPDVRVPFAKVTVQCYVERVSLSATGYYATPDIRWDWATTSGRPFAYFAGGAAVAEVEVDGYTGMSRVRRVDIVHDVGDSLNPGVDRGQIEGGFVQGIGWLTSEELKWDAAGRLLTHSASTYQIPAIGDAPMEFNVTLLPNAANAHAVHGSKAVGEPPLMLAISVREALRDAIAAFGAPGGAVKLASPATSEAVWRAIAARKARAG
ncbi:MAG TPA: xanthine dehydrogenase molybdopterin binding subunit [Opitutaceae bacterium]|nr:xanthine dehydrogenase molybdopterin binding subunit [Opitutaceae bacterium]